MNSTLPASRTVAAVDLGSNSFHMLVARVDNCQLQVVDRLRETVRLGAGLDADNRLTAEAREAALACLQRFGQRLRDMAPGSVRVVGTNTLRKAREAGEFLDQAEQALGHPIEVISGIEEARLIYLGVSHTLADDSGQRLVVDIGGGSTELIVGERFEPVQMESLYMGCVSMSRDHFADGVIDKERMRRAELAARVELEGIAQPFRELGWSQAVGSSGTIKAIGRVLRTEFGCRDGITAGGLKKLRKAMLTAGHVDRLPFRSQIDDRAAVFSGGTAILIAIFEALGLERMEVSEGALREGLVYDLVGRLGHEDVRERTVRRLCERYLVDETHGRRVEKTAGACLDQVAGDWNLGKEAFESALSWAARLHEIGLAIAHSQFHKHGAYLLEHSDLPGFSQQEQQLLAALVLGHRRKFPTSVFRQRWRGRAEPRIRLCILLRLAVLLHRSRSKQPLPTFRLHPRPDGLTVVFPPGWLDDHALTATDLAQEANFLKAADFHLEYR